MSGAAVAVSAPSSSPSSSSPPVPLVPTQSKPTTIATVESPRRGHVNDNYETFRQNDAQRAHQREYLGRVTQPSNGECSHCSGECTQQYIDARVPVVRFDRERGLGALACVPDGVLSVVWKHCDAAALATLARCSHELNFLLSDETFWKRYCRKRYHATLWWKGTWKSTALHAEADARAHPELPYGDKGFVPAKPYCVCDGKATHYRLPRFVNAPARAYRRRFHEQYYLSLPLPLVTLPPHRQNIPRRDARTLSLEQFIDEFERPNRPVILTHAMDDWPCMREWSTPADLLARFGDVLFRVGSGYRMTVAQYFDYMYNQRETSPLYFFDGKFQQKSPAMLDGYSVPKYFRTDFFASLGEDDRPPYRWVVMGPERTGAAFHTDPYNTSAWNAVVFGKKQWTLYAPDEEQPPGTGDPDSEYYEAPRPIKWFTKHYNRLRHSQQPLEAIQEAGEIIFVPGGWWHQVLNLEPTLAFTQNIVDHQNIGYVAQDTRKDPSFARELRAALKRDWPDVFANGADPFLRDDESTLSDSTDSSDYTSSDDEDD